MNTIEELMIKYKDEIKQKLDWIELYENGLSHINGAYAEILNLKKLKTKIVYDVILHYGEENRTQRFNGIERDRFFDRIN